MAENQAERRRVMIEERRLKTYHGHAQSSVDDERGGRFAFSGSSATVTGASPIAYPAQPAGSPWASDPIGSEPPLGYSVETQETVGEPHEVRALSSVRQDGGDGATDTGVVRRNGWRRF